MLHVQPITKHYRGELHNFAIRDVLWCCTIGESLEDFGSTCYPVNLVKDKGNHDPKAWAGIFVGYQDQQLSGWRIYLPRSNEFIVTAHASFIDHRLGCEPISSKQYMLSEDNLDRLSVEMYEAPSKVDKISDTSTSSHR